MFLQKTLLPSREKALKGKSIYLNLLRGTQARMAAPLGGENLVKLNKTKGDGANHQAIVDVKRTEEVVVFGIINGKVVIQYRNAATIDEEMPTKIVEKVDDKGKNSNQRAREKSSMKKEDAIEEVQKGLKFEPEPLSQVDINKNKKK